MVQDGYFVEWRDMVVDAAREGFAAPSRPRRGTTGTCRCWRQCRQTGCHRRRPDRYRDGGPRPSWCLRGSTVCGLFPRDHEAAPAVCSQAARKVEFSLLLH
ncbi:hypothetical protein GQ55_6G050300 [Panicum hallii var. hallii]|uniref:Uncharacterized protein n=1 Tax=Panicum hallii var. hallii TaxID=1504633 RepID=A0A2T7D400_9POAL|nr:hypothetical protein GQ55_6G050300 [Panicum hallii var. hallii]